MANAERTATTVWEGDLAHGNGVLSLTSGAASDLPVTWASRTERSEGKTSPEELVAAAHASCFSMALSHALAESGHAPERLDVSATVTLSLDGGPEPSRSGPPEAFPLLPVKRPGACTLLAQLEHRKEGLLRHLHAPDLLHAPLALLLLLQELALARDVAAVALGGDVLAEGLDGLARDDLRAHRGLDRHVVLLPRDLREQLLCEVAPDAV